MAHRLCSAYCEWLADRIARFPFSQGTSTAPQLGALPPPPKGLLHTLPQLLVPEDFPPPLPQPPQGMQGPLGALPPQSPPGRSPPQPDHALYDPMLPLPGELLLSLNARRLQSGCNMAYGSCSGA